MRSIKSGRAKGSHPTRGTRGGMIALVGGITAIFLVTLLIFSFKMTTMFGSFNEQRTAIEGAALQVAKDMSSLDVAVPNVGYVGLSDSAPIGKGTTAGDNFATPVIGINTLAATVRIDMMIANLLNDKVMKQRAQDDYTNLTTAVAQLQQAILSGSGRDANNNQINFQADAIKEYNANLIRMSGSNNNVSNMKVTFGYLNYAGSGTLPATNTPVPQPYDSGQSQITSAMQQSGYYLTGINVPFQMTGAPKYPFFFTSTGSAINLVDPNNFTTTVPAEGATLLVPSVVKCEADQTFNETDEHGKPRKRVVHCVACAQCANFMDPRPNPGAICFSFPNGLPPEISRPWDFYNDPSHVINWSPVDKLETAAGNSDYPDTALQPFSQCPYFGGNMHPVVTQPMSLAIYDWIRRGGATVNLSKLNDWFRNAAFTASPPGNRQQPQVYAFQMIPDTTSQGVPTSKIVTTQSPQGSIPDIMTRRVSNQQWVALAGGALVSKTGYIYDLDIKDHVYNEGTINGGIHAGEPLSNQIPSASANGGSNSGANGQYNYIDEPPPNAGPNFPQIQPAGVSEYPVSTSGASGSARSTYLNMGMAVDIKLRFSCYPFPNGTPYVPLPSN